MIESRDEFFHKDCVICSFGCCDFGNKIVKYSLKVQILIYFFLQAQKIQDPEQLKIFTKIVEECKAEIGITDEQAEKTKKGDFSDRSEKNQCFAACIFKKGEFFDKDGKLVRDTMIKKLLHKEPDASKIDEVAKVVDMCIDRTGSNQCETAFNVIECYYKIRFGPKEHLEVVQKCMEEHKVTAETALKLKTGDFTERGKNAQCLMSCIFNKKNYFKDGKLQLDTMIEGAILKEGIEFREQIMKAVNKCAAITGADDCETSYKLYECYWNARFGPMKTLEFLKTCSKENNITEDLADRLKVGILTDRSQNVQCFGACMFKKQGVFDKDGKLIRDVMIGRLIQKEPETPKFDEIIKAVDKCIGLGGKTECETAFNFYECYWMNRFGVLPPTVNPKIGEVLKSVIGA